ncbi:DMT family transporter [Paracoccus aminophilus]|uniref:EamA domain-containing protein n=1 Tax=Paracoccus aminophilus JCM 7686 TaxID=1367847 RepID=S5YDA4_PARAH|nr:DMT family transporter [Paracoccus aminophilus]AGT09438.1 hypothetical protein JCM7686_2368 [Paracoccus aminophilus JCM 7686]
MGWILATLIAAVAQTGRNAAQTQLTRQIGTMGATAVRFLFGLPFALFFLGAVALFEEIPLPGAATLGWTALGAVAQIGATAFMLQAMNLRGFGVVTALTKTEPVTLALMGALIFHEYLGPMRLAAIVIATLGVVMMSGATQWRGNWWPMFLGVLSGALFGLSSIGFRGGILNLPSGDFLVRATTTLALNLTMQTVLVLLWLGLANRAALRGMAQHWKNSLGAGFLGAFASQFWFIGFALAPAANVRTLALIEVPMAQLVSGRVFKQKTSPRQLIGMALIVLGVGLLIAVSV